MRAVESIWIIRFLIPQYEQLIILRRYYNTAVSSTAHLTEMVMGTWDTYMNSIPTWLACS